MDGRRGSGVSIPAGVISPSGAVVQYSTIPYVHRLHLGTPPVHPVLSEHWTPYIRSTKSTTKAYNINQIKSKFK